MSPVSLFVGMPLLLALIAVSVREDACLRIARIGAAVIGLFAIGLAFALALHSHTTLDENSTLQIAGIHLHWRVDGLSAPFLPLVAVTTWLALMGAPRAELSKASVVSLLVIEASALGVYTSVDLSGIALYWTLGLLPNAMLLLQSRIRDVKTRAARTYILFSLLGVIPLFVAAAFVGITRSKLGSEHPLDLSMLDGAPLPIDAQKWVFVLLTLTVLLRKGILPFHSWLPVMIERAPVLSSLSLVSTHFGAFLALRVMLSLAPDVAPVGFPILSIIALASAVYQSFVALAQQDFKRTLAFIMSSQLAMILVGVGELDHEGLHGAMLQMLCVSLTSTGLLLIASAIEARVGTTDIRRLGGLAQTMPKFAWSFLLLALALVGLPGTLGFVAEDLLIHSLLTSHPAIATVLLLVTVANGITLLRLFFSVFMGPWRDNEIERSAQNDMLTREVFVAASLFLAVLIGGIAPQGLLDVRQHVIEGISSRGTAPRSPNHASVHWASLPQARSTGSKSSHN